MFLSFSLTCFLPVIHTLIAGVECDNPVTPYPPPFSSIYLNIFIFHLTLHEFPFFPSLKTKNKKNEGKGNYGVKEGGEKRVREELPVHHFNNTINSHAPAHNVYFKQSSVSLKNILVMSEAWICCLLVPPCSSGLFSSPCCVFLLFSLWLRCVNHSLPAIGWRVCVKKLPERRFLSKSP